MTSLEFHITALATATDWRWPPESEATGWRTERTVVTCRPARVLAASRSIVVLVEQAAAQALAPEEHVLDDVQIVAQRQVLVDDLDPERRRLARAADADGLALPEDLAGVRFVDAGDAS